MNTFRLDWRSNVLPNGLRLITAVRQGTPTVAVRVYVRAGSRYDSEQASRKSSVPPFGLAHLTEHLLFCGTQHRSQRDLFAAVERLGGTLDADTAKEYISLSAIVTPQGMPTVLGVLAELLIEPALREDDLHREKAVVLEEIRRAQDRENLLYELFAQTLWQKHALRNPILGTPESVSGLEYELLESFQRQRFVAGNMLLVICGNIEHAAAEHQVAQRFATLAHDPEQRPTPVREPTLDRIRRTHVERDIHQMHLLIGVPTTDMKHPDRSGLKVIERVLGMGGSARLYQRLRQEERLVYSVNTVTAHYEDAGYFAIHTACAPRHAPHVERIILETWDELRQYGITAEELKVAQGNYAGTLARRFETNQALAGILGIEGLLHRVETLHEAVQRINAVTCEDVQRVAQKYLDTGKYVVASLGRA